MQEQESPFDSFARFLEPESCRALDLAREEMFALSHWWIGTGHLLWGLASEGILASFLTAQGMTPERIHDGMAFICDRSMQQSHRSRALHHLRMSHPRHSSCLLPAPNR